MGRNKVASRDKRKKGAHTPDEIKKGIDLHMKGVSIRSAAKGLNLPYPTLRRYIKKYIENPSIPLEPQYDATKVFNDEQEASLCQYVVECADKFYGLTARDCRQVAYQMAVINKVEMPVTWRTNKLAGKDWLRGFRARHPNLSIKKPEACSMARATAFNRVNVNKFFDNLKLALNRSPSFANGSRLYNLDETATTTVQRPQKVLAVKGRNVSKVTSGERGVLVTTCCIVNALGHALPPAMVFPRKKIKSHMLYGAPSGTLGLASPSGWMTADLFVDVMKHFIEYSSATQDNPALLILDNHESHLSLAAIELAKASGVTMLTLHPHTTAKMQPLDVGLNGPFKAYYNSAVDSWLVRNPGKTVTIYNIAECVGTAYMRAMTPTNITSAFRKCGIFPYDSQIFTDLDFLPSEVTDRDAPVIDSDQTDAEDAINEHPQNESRSPLATLNNAEHTGNDTVMPTRPILNTATVALSEANHDLPAVSAEIQVDCPEQNNAEKPSTSHSFKTVENFVSPKVFRPALKAEPRKRSLAKRRVGKSMIVTDTPEKDELAARKANKKSQKRVKVAKKDIFKCRKEKTYSSDEGDECVLYSGSSSGGDNFLSASEDEEILLDGDFPSMARNPLPKDYVIVVFKSKKTDVYYVAEILEELDDDEECDFFVSYLKLKSKATQLFSMPLEPDTAGVNRRDIKYILPRPIMRGSTSRQQAIYKFPVDLSQLNLRY